jgi:hypothetical protein
MIFIPRYPSEYDIFLPFRYTSFFDSYRALFCFSCSLYIYFILSLPIFSFSVPFLPFLSPFLICLQHFPYFSLPPFILPPPQMTSVDIPLPRGYFPKYKPLRQRERSSGWSSSGPLAFGLCIPPFLCYYC